VPADISARAEMSAHKTLECGSGAYEFMVSGQVRF
jgi:hypothetical protein